jgi:hypothetical protein
MDRNSHQPQRFVAVRLRCHVRQNLARVRTRSLRDLWRASFGLRERRSKICANLKGYFLVLLCRKFGSSCIFFDCRASAWNYYVSLVHRFCDSAVDVIVAKAKF